MISPLELVSRYFFPLLVLNWIASRITSKSLYQYAAATLPYHRSPLVWPKRPGTFHYNSDNPSGYEQTLCEKNLQLMKLQSYIKNIVRCLIIVHLIYSRVQYHKHNTLIKCDTLFTSQLSTNYNNIQQESNIQTKPEQSTIPTKLYSSIVLHHMVIFKTQPKPCLIYVIK